MPRRLTSLATLLIPTLLFAACGDETNLTGGSSSSSSSSSSSGAGGAGGDPYSFAVAPASCAYICPQTECAESTSPYECPSLRPWAEIPHAPECPTWDGKFPAPVAGKCTVSAPAGDAAKYAGLDPNDPSVLVMPGGRRLTPAGAEFEFPEPEGMTSNLIAVPGTGYMITLDTGNGDHILRVVDPSLIGAGAPVVSQVNFPDPEALNQGLVFSPPDRVFVASAQGVVQALALDTATGTLTRDDARSITLPASPASPGGSFYVSGVAVSTDDTRLFASGVDDSRLVVADVTHGGAGYGAVLGTVDLGAVETFNVFVDPHDPTTHFVYATMWANRAVKEVDVSNPAAPVVSRTFEVSKGPQSVAFLDERWMVVGNDLGDTLALVDRVSGTVTEVRVDSATVLNGLEPSSLLFDAASQRLYATEAGYNSVSAYDVDLALDPPTIAPAGRLPAEWWPSAAATMADGSLVVTSLLARGIGPHPNNTQYELLHGGIQRIPPPTATSLAAGEARVAINNEVALQPGQPVVTCPSGANDFPIPTTNTGARSPAIEHVFIVVRENKSFDGLFGDFPGVKGDPVNLMVPAAEMDGIWGNIRKLAKTFAHGDNFYTSAFLSTQGHLWATHGRTTDFNEREWPVTGYGRGLRGDADSGGVAEVSRPDEGSLFDWLGKHDVEYEVMGEIVGLPSVKPEGYSPVDGKYPGGIIQSIGYPDIEKACYVAGRARVLCNARSVTYLTLPNDHTKGVSSQSPTPQTMFAVNDEATGMLVDGLSHSPIWPKTLVIVMEDDPAGGAGDSVDYHRTILVMASPWLKRGYVSKAQLDVSSVHKLVAHVFALPYPNVQVAKASLPLDMFTGAPDFTPYEYLPRTLPLACGSAATAAEERLTSSWDLDDVDQQDGLGEQVLRWLRGEQYTELPPSVEAAVGKRIARKSGGPARPRRGGDD